MVIERLPDFEEDYGLGPGETFEPADFVDEPEPDGPVVRTVLGAVDPAVLGVCLVGESFPGLTDEPNEERTEALRHGFLAELEDARLSGIGAMVVQAADARQAEAMRWIAERAGLHLILAVSPVGANGHLIDVPAHAGVLDLGEVPVETPAVRDAIDQSLPLGLRLDSLERFYDHVADVISMGVGPERIMVRGLSLVDDPEVARRVLEAGCWLVCQATDQSADVAAGRIAELIAGGFGERLLLGSGVTDRRQLRAFGGAMGWSFVLERFALLMMEAGVAAMTMRQLLVENPARALVVRA